MEKHSECNLYKNQENNILVAQEIWRTIPQFTGSQENKLGLSCAKLRPALASYPLAPVQASYPLRVSTLLTELAPAEK